MTRNRRGVALLAALWLIVAIAAVAVQFEFVGRERRLIGLNASDRGRQLALAQGALAQTYGRMDYDLRNGGNNASIGNISGLRAADPWLDADSIYSATVYVDSTPVTVVAHDLGNTINVNTASEDQLRLLFGFISNDYSTADQLAQAILDWRDPDDTRRPSGAEKDDYIKNGNLVLPSNGPFREVDDLIYVYGMTPDFLELVRPYLTTHGTGADGSTAALININTAPEAVLRALPGMTDVILVNILALRSQGRRITSVNQVMTAATRGGRGGAPGGRGGAAQPSPTETALTSATTVNTQAVELTMLVQNPAQVQPTRLVALVTRAGTNANLAWQLW